jgi:hypothetical protein
MLNILNGIVLSWVVAILGVTVKLFATGHYRPSDCTDLESTLIKQVLSDSVKAHRSTAFY